MRSSEHNCVNISSRSLIDGKMLNFGMEACFILFYLNVTTKLVILQIKILWRHHFSTLLSTTFAVFSTPQYYNTMCSLSLTWGVEKNYEGSSQLIVEMDFFLLSTWARLITTAFSFNRTPFARFPVISRFWICTRSCSESHSHSTSFRTGAKQWPSAPFAV